MRRKLGLSLALLTVASLFFAQERGIDVVAKKAAGQEIDVGRQYALIIGIDRYAEWPGLRSAVSEAKAVKTALASRYYIDEFIELYDEAATAVGIRRALMETLPAKLGRNDSLLVFYAGHGYTDRTKTGFWIASDGTKDLLDQRGWISNQQLRNMIAELKAQRILVMADACFSGDLLDTRRGPPVAIDSAYYKRALSLTARQVLTSGSSESVPDSSEFGRQLLNLLERNEAPILDPNQIYDRVKLGMTQTQPLLGTLPGNEQGASFVFFLKSAAERSVLTASAPAPQAVPPQAPGTPRLTVSRAYGSLSISTVSPGLLYLDGTALGELPAGADARLDEVEVGERRLELRYAGGQTESKTVTVQKGGASSVSFSWKPVTTGTLVVRSEPSGALVSVNGSPRGQTPLTLSDLSPGSLSLALSQPGYEAVTQSKPIEAGKTTEVSFILKKLPAEPPAGTSSVSGGFVRLPAGSFTMGSPATEKDHRSNEVQHEVRISAFSIGQYEVTQAEWKAVMGSNPSDFTGDERLPVENVSWYDILVYCNKRSLAEGLTPCYSISGSTDPVSWGVVPTSSNYTWDAARCDFSASGYRLPTEAEWEYACRAGTKTATAFGDTLVSSQANFNGNYQYNVSTKGIYLQKMAKVGSYAPNAWGLYDMHGNVFEWCWDWYGDYASGVQSDPMGARSGSYRVLRGGSWIDIGLFLRSALRGSNYPYFRFNSFGFRLVVGR